MLNRITKTIAALTLCGLPFLVNTSNAQSDDTGPIYVCDTQSVDICGVRPPLPAGGVGWIDEEPHGKEDDGGQADPTEWGDDNDLGPATQNEQGEFCIEITNSGGDLFGPTGGDQNGDFEGDCIEVKICWPYNKRVHHSLLIGYDRLDRPIYYRWTTIERFEACTPWVEVCPCDE